MTEHLSLLDVSHLNDHARFLLNSDLLASPSRISTPLALFSIFLQEYLTDFRGGCRVAAMAQWVEQAFLKSRIDTKACAYCQLDRSWIYGMNNDPFFKRKIGLRFKASLTNLLSSGMYHLIVVCTAAVDVVAK